jgi:hypothetical protein
VDAPESDQAPREVERARDAPVRGSAALERGPDERGQLGRLASAIGNRGFGRLVARMQEGDGIMPGGVVHPDVEAAIAHSRGRGSALDGSVSHQLEPAYGESLGDVRVHTDSSAAALARAVAARAFTVGPDIFFASGEYRPNTHDGDELIAHEVAHVIQQRGAPDSGPLTVTQPGDALEREAEARARDITA